jgi:hypothetical protein
MSGSRRPSCALRSLAKRLESVALPPRSPALRVWLPSRRRQHPPTRGSLFQLPTLVGFALQSFHPPRRSGRRFPFLSFHPGSFPPNLPGLAVELGRLDPTEEAVPPPASLDVYSRAGPHALLGLSTFRALPPEEPEAGLLSPTSPLPFFPPNGLAAARERNLRGFRLFRPGISLRRGRRPVWPFPPTALCCPLGSPPAAGYFFASGTQAPLRELRWPS